MDDLILHCGFHYYGKVSILALRKNFLETSNFYKLISEKDYAAAWILEDYFPTNKEYRKMIWEMFKNIQTTKDVYLKDVMFRMLENESFRNYVMQIDEKFRKPMFLEKRKHYLSLLEQGLAVDYAIYNLIKLGDYEPGYLVYMQRD
jgi:hypothetical protein